MTAILALPPSMWALVMCASPHLPATADNPHRFHPEIIRDGWEKFLDRHATPYAATHNLVIAWPAGCTPPDRRRILGRNADGQRIPCDLRSARWIPNEACNPLAVLCNTAHRSGKRVMCYVAPPSWGMLDLQAIEGCNFTDVGYDAVGSIARKSAPAWLIRSAIAVHIELAPENNPAYDWCSGVQGYINMPPQMGPKLHGPNNSVGRATEHFVWLHGGVQMVSHTIIESAEKNGITIPIYTDTVRAATQQEINHGKSRTATPAERLELARQYEDAGYIPIIEPSGIGASNA